MKENESKSDKVREIVEIILRLPATALIVLARLLGQDIMKENDDQVDAARWG